MSKYIFFNSVSKNPVSIASPSYEGLYVDGGIYGDNIAKLTQETDDNLIYTANYLKNDFTIGIRQGKPSEYHDWDTTTESWVEKTDRSALLAKRLLKIERLREEKDSANLLYDGKILQVASIDRENVTGKINEIQTKIESNIVINASEMYWRDYNNVIHTWVTPATYLQWLKLLVVSFAERRSALYLKSWEHKTAIETLVADTNSSIEDILSYDITSGW